jgi:hypothetical protein
MGKGLLAWWRRRILARGVAGAALFAIPVAVAAAIGFGTSLSGVAGGLSAVTSGPDAVPASAQTSTNLNNAVVALAGKPSGSVRPSSDSTTGSGGSNGSVGGSNLGTTGGGSSTGSGGSGNPVSSPVTLGGGGAHVTLPGGSGTDPNSPSGTVNGTVNNVLGGVNETITGLLGH